MITRCLMGGSFETINLRDANISISGSVGGVGGPGGRNEMEATRGSRSESPSLNRITVPDLIGCVQRRQFFEEPIQIATT